MDPYLISFQDIIKGLIPSEVHVFGYGADSDGNWSHYFEVLTNKNLKTGQHPGQHEFEILQQLAYEKIVKLYQRKIAAPWQISPFCVILHLI
ncbi:hypothetical protein AMECASPLE_026279 [Ameca splendens]|uniref:Uncharacterized protein n=1 Tax=Ameca splendens TaxID=208324 RepID=A0ABV0ZF31_9TELE